MIIAYDESLWMLRVLVGAADPSEPGRVLPPAPAQRLLDHLPPRVYVLLAGARLGVCVCLCVCVFVCLCVEGVCWVVDCREGGS